MFHALTVKYLLVPIAYHEYSWWGLVESIQEVPPNPDFYYCLSEIWPKDTPKDFIRHSVAFPTIDSACFRIAWGLRVPPYERYLYGENINKLPEGLHREVSRREKIQGHMGGNFRWEQNGINPTRRLRLPFGKH